MNNLASGKDVRLGGSPLLQTRQETWMIFLLLGRLHFVDQSFRIRSRVSAPSQNLPLLVAIRYAKAIPTVTRMKVPNVGEVP